MGFLHSCRGGGAGTSGVKYYTIPIDNTSFIQSDSMFKANIVHSLNTNNLIVQVDDGKRVENVVYKYLNDNEIEFYYKSASDVVVTVIGFGKTKQDDLSIVGLGVVGKIVIGKDK